VRRALLATFKGAGVLLALTLQAAWALQPLPTLLKILPLSLLAASMARPHLGLLILASIGPMADAISMWAGSPFPGIRLLEQLVLAFVSGAGLRWWREAVDVRLGEPAALIAASTIASCIAVQPALLIRRLPDATASDHFRSLFQDGEYFFRSGVWDPLFFAALTVQGAALAVTVERVVRRRAATAGQALRMAVLGHAGVAALNLEQIVGGAIRTGDAWRAFVNILRDVRVSRFYDVNAAGSTFLLMLLAGVGLFPGGRRWMKVALAALIASLAAGLWVAGSRVALAAGAVVVLGMLWVIAWRTRGRTRWLAAAGLATVLAASGLTALIYPAARNVSAAQAATTRRILAETAINMWRAAPVFGVGVGRFFEESSRFGGEALKVEAAVSVANENAHNYFLQILATEGSVGLAALLLALGVVIMPATRAERTTRVPLRRWLLAGVIATLLTWMAGHPLLVPEASFAFWLSLGVLAALAPPPAAGAWRTAIAVGAVLVLTTAPFRASLTIRDADLEHIGVGLSRWQPEIDGIRYRTADQAFALYLPADGTAVTLPLRRAPGVPDPLAVTIRADGRTIRELQVSGETWQQVDVQLPATNSRFARADFDVRPVGAGDGPLPSPLVYVGKAAPK
jgi:O-antigen ligase